MSEPRPSGGPARPSRGPARPSGGRRIFLVAIIAFCLLFVGLVSYRGIEHAVLRARLRSINRRIAVLEQRLEQYENLEKIFNDSSLARLADSLKAADPDRVPR